MLPLSRLGEDARLAAGLLEPAKGAIDRFVLPHFNLRHVEVPLPSYDSSLLMKGAEPNSTGRPSQRTAAQKMKVKMGDDLAGVLTRVRDQAVARFRQTLRLGDPRESDEKPSE